jgi:hypothetical protein
VVTAGPLLHLSTVLRLVGPLHLRGDAELGGGTSRVVVRFAGRDVTSWGQPHVLGTLGLELLF